MRWDVLAAVKRLGLEVTEVRRRRVHAKCPFHADGKNANWSIAHDGPNAGKYHCFACSAGGDLVKLVMHVAKLDTRDLAEVWLADSSMAMPSEPAPEEVEIVLRHRTGHRFQLPSGVTFGPVDSWPSPVRDYLCGSPAPKRGVPAWQVERWGIGYATGGRLRGRVVLVVRGADGEPASYNARLFTIAKPKDVRYLTPRDEEHADKDALFGEHLWPPVRERDTLFASEGGFKSLALERASRGYVGAVSGSELRPAHARKLATWRRVVFVRDSGAAGEKIAEAVDRTVARHALVEHVRLPGTEDADSLPLEDLRDCLTSSQTS